MTKNEDELKKLFEAFNDEQLRVRLTPSEILKVKELLPKIDDALKVHERAKWIIRIIYVGVPIILAVWQFFERLWK